jgi:hypothetical protein
MNTGLKQNLSQKKTASRHKERSHRGIHQTASERMRLKTPFIASTCIGWLHHLAVIACTMKT